MTAATVRHLLAREAAARGVSVARLREVARERLAGVANEFNPNEVP